MGTSIPRKSSAWLCATGLACSLTAFDGAADARPLPFSAWQRPSQMPLVTKLKFSAPQTMMSGSTTVSTYAAKAHGRKPMLVYVPVDPATGARTTQAAFAITTNDHNGAFKPDHEAIKNSIAQNSEEWARRIKAGEVTVQKTVRFEGVGKGSELHKYFGQFGDFDAQVPTKMKNMGDVLVVQGHGSPTSGIGTDLSANLHTQARQLVELADATGSTKVVFNSCNAHTCAGTNGLGALVEEYSGGRVQLLAPDQPGYLYGNDLASEKTIGKKKWPAVINELYTQNLDESTTVPGARKVKQYGALPSELPPSSQPFKSGRFYFDDIHPGMLGLGLFYSVGVGVVTDLLLARTNLHPRVNFLIAYAAGEAGGLLFTVLSGGTLLEGAIASAQMAPFALPAAFSIHLANEYSAAIDELVALKEKSGETFTEEELDDVLFYRKIPQKLWQTLTDSTVWTSGTSGGR